MAQTESKIHQRLMMNRMGEVLQLHLPHLILPKRVDHIARSVKIHYINFTKGRTN